MQNKKEEPVEDAYVMLYGISYGGLFPMMRLNTDETGSLNIPFGRGGCFISAGKDSLVGYSYLNLNDNTTCTITLEEPSDIEMDFLIQFPPPVKKSFDWIEPHRTEEHKLRSEIAGLRFDRRWNNRLQQQKFLDFFDKASGQDARDEMYYKEREKFLLQTSKLAESTADYLKVMQGLDGYPTKENIMRLMITDWDIKELVELPDSAAIYNAIDIFAENRINFDLPDSLWRSFVLNQTFSRVPSPENGWRMPFYEKIEHLKANNEQRTFDNIIEWVDNQIEIDSTLTWTYFTGVLDPNQMLNMKHISASERLYLINDALVLLGVPTKWTGFLSYYNGEEFRPVESNPEEDGEDDHKTIEKAISVFVDSEQVQASPWGNFLLARHSDNGVLRYIFIEEETDSLDATITYYTNDDDHIVLESFIRNSNGDAHVKVRSIDNNNDAEVIELTTPIEFFNNMRQWDEEIVAKIKQLQKNKQPTLIFVNNKKDLEPQQRMLEQLRNKKSNFAEKNCEIIIYSEDRNLKDDDFKVIKGEKLSKLDQEEYPLIFLLDEDGTIIYSVNGYYMGVADLILRQL